MNLNNDYSSVKTESKFSYMGNMQNDLIFLRWLFWGGSILSLILTLFAAYMLYKGGNAISNIKSVGGQTMDEAYYYNLGRYIFRACSWLTLALGIFFSSVLWKMGREVS